jgi:hypothetical protein
MTVVNMPDGTPVSFPDTMPPEQIKGLIAQKFPAHVEKAAPSFAQKVGQDLAQREQNRQEIVNSRQNGEIGYIHSGLQQGGNAAGLLNDIAGEAISEVTPDWLKGAGRFVLDYASNLPSFGGGTIGERIPQELNRLEKNHPVIARDIGAAVNIGSLLSAGKIAGNPDNFASAVGAVGQGAKSVAEKAGSAVTKTTEAAKNLIPSKPVQKTAADLKKMAGESYDEAAYLGANFSPEHVADKFSAEVQKMKPAPIAGKVLTSEDKTLINSIDDYKELAGQPMSLEDVKRLDETLTQKINGFIDRTTGSPDAHGRKLMILQDKLREIVDNVPDQPGVDALNNGKKLWAAQRRLQDLENIVERASMTQNPGTALQTGYRNLYMNKARIRGYSKEEVALLKKAATPGLADDALGLIGSRLNAIAAAAAGGGFGGAAAAHVVGIAGRGAKEKVIAGRGIKLQNKMVNRAVSETSKNPLIDLVSKK